MPHRQTKMFAVIAALLVYAAHSRGQSCLVKELQAVASPLPSPYGDSFGLNVQINGNTALVSAPWDNTFAPDGGNVYSLQRQGDQWVFAQSLGSGIVSANDTFGRSLASDGLVAVVGAPKDVAAGVSGGSAYVFRLVDGAWEFEQQLVAADPNAGDTFGASVAVHGDVIIVGATHDDEGGTNAGAAYVFRTNGKVWTQEQKLLETSATLLRNVGMAVEIENDLAFVVRVATPNVPRAVLMFRKIAGTWTQVQTILQGEGNNGDEFGASIDLEGSTLVIGAPFHTVAPHSQNGAVYVFTEQGSGGPFAFTQKLTAAAPANADMFGKSVALAGDRLVIGVPQRDIRPFPYENVTSNAGVIMLFERQGGLWSERMIGHARPRFNWSYTDNNLNAWLGAAVDISGEHIIAGGPLDPLWSSAPGEKVLFFNVDGPDCDGDGIPDDCENDCNANSTPDECEIADQFDVDCDANGALDLCDNGFDYAIDDPDQPTAVMGGSSAFDLLWLNHFTVVPGGQRITHIAIAWLSFGPHGLPGQAVIYDDPNNDGNPSDAVLLTTRPVSLLTDFGTAGDVHTVYRVPTTYVGEPGDSFFIGGYMSKPANEYVAVNDTIDTPGHTNWRLIAPLGSDITVLSTAWSLAEIAGDWAVRGIALDCNGNGVWDDCDIASAFSQDANRNNIPDECEAASCPADIAGADGHVNVSDLLLVIGNWGSCPVPPSACAADINGDLTVNVTDLLAVIAMWGPCP